MGVYEKEYEIFYQNVDMFKNLSIPYLMDLFSDIASSQSEYINLGVQYQKEHNVAWVLYKWNIEILKNIKYEDKIKIRTMAYSFKKFYAYRTFEVENSKGEIVATAKSTWLMIDINKRRAIRIPNEFCIGYGSISDEQLKLEDVTKFNGEKQEDIKVKYSNIDCNNHVNNVNYIRWALDNTPLEYIEKREIKEIRIVYSKEAIYGENVEVYTEFNCDKEDIIGLYKFNHEDTELCKIQILFK